MENIDFFRNNYINNPQEFEKLLSAIQTARALHNELSDITELRSSIDSMHHPTFEDMLPYLRRFLTSISIRKYFEQEAKCSLNSDIYQPIGKALNNEIMTGLQFVESQRFAVAAVAVDPSSLAFKKHRNKERATSIRMVSKDALLRFVKAGGAVITIHSCDAITDSTPATADMRCRLERTFEVKEGDEVVLRAGRDSLSFESCESSACIAQAYLKYSPVPVTPEFDACSLKLIGLSSSNDTSSRIQLMSTILRLFKHSDAFDSCLPFIKHSDYFVRWYVMRELLAMNPDRAWPMVVDMAEHDPNQEVRKTASRTLELFRNPSIIA